MGTCQAGPLAPSTLHLHKELQKIRCRISLATTLCVCGCMYTYVCVDLFMHMCVWTYAYVCVWTYVCICVCGRMYAYVCVLHAHVWWQMVAIGLPHKACDYFLCSL